MDYEKYNNSWGNQNNFPNDWNCDCGKEDKEDKKVFYGYFVATDCHTGNKQDETPKKDCYKKEEIKHDNHESNSNCNRNNTRRCCCPFCNLFRCFR